MAQVVIVNFQKGLAFTDDGMTLPILNWFTEFNEPTDDWTEAVTFVAGTGQFWYAGRMDDWVKAVIN
jgi:hypothetical protein